MNKKEIIELLTPKCNGCDLPLSLDVNLIADILINESKCEHPYWAVSSRCMGEINKCNKCGETL